MPPTTSQHVVRDPDETLDIEDLIKQIFPNKDDRDNWKQAENPVLGGRRPKDFIGQPDEQQLRELLRAAKHGYLS